MKSFFLSILLISSFLFSSAQNAITTYTFTPYGDKGILFYSSSGQVSMRPTRSFCLQYSRDSVKVKVSSIFDNSQTVMSVPDSIIHFYSGSFHFETKYSLDSFYSQVLNK